MNIRTIIQFKGNLWLLFRIGLYRLKGYLIVLYNSFYYRNLSYCFCRAIDWICVAISRVDKALKPWSAICLGVDNSKQKPAYLNLPVPIMLSLLRQLGGGIHYFDSRAQTAMQQHVVEHKEHDKAQQKSWSSTVSGLRSRCLDTVLPLDPGRPGRESEIDCAPLPYCNQIHSAHHLNQQHSHSKQTYESYTKSHVMGERGSSRWGNTGSCTCCVPAHRRFGSVRSLLLSTKQYKWFGSRSDRLSWPF